MINKAILLGRLTKEPDMITGQTLVARFGLATNEKYKGEERVEFHNLVAFGKLAEIIEKYCHKGDMVYVEGKIQTDKYNDKEGVTKYSTKIIVQTLRMIPTQRREDTPGGAQTQNTDNRKESVQSMSNSTYGGTNFTADDIPF